MKTRTRLLIALVLLQFCKPVAAQNYFERYSSQNLGYASLKAKLDSVYATDDSLRIKRGTGYKDFMRWQWITQTRKDQNNFMEAYFEAYQKAAAGRMKQQPSPAFKANAGEQTGLPATWCDPLSYRANWKPVGYDQRPAGSSRNNGMGWMSCTWVSPTNPSLILAGSNNGGLWKTTSGGSVWDNITHDQIMGMGANCLAVHPSNNNIILIGASFGDGQRGASGLWRTINGGSTWTRSNVNGQVKNWTIRKIVHNPNNPNQVFAIARDWVIFDDFIMISNDGGINFNDVIHGIRSGGVSDNVDYDWQDVEVHLDNSNNVTIWVAGNVTIKSTNGGTDFSVVPRVYTYPHGSTETISMNIAVTRQSGNRNIMYRTYEARHFTGTVLDSINMIIEKSTDNGNTWTLRYFSGWYDVWDAAGPDYIGVSSRKGIFAISAKNPDIVYMGRVEFVYWDDNQGILFGKNQSPLYNPFYLYYFGIRNDNIHVDYRGISTVVDQNNDEWIYVATDGGMYKGKFRDLTPPATIPWQWTDISGQGLQVQQVYKVTLAPELGKIFTGHQDLSIQGYTLPASPLAPYENGSWGQLFYSGGDGGNTIYDKDYPSDLITVGNTALERVPSTENEITSPQYAFIGSGNYIGQPLVYFEGTSNLYAGLRKCTSTYVGQDGKTYCGSLGGHELIKASNPFSTSYNAVFHNTAVSSFNSSEPVVGLAVSEDEQTMYVAFNRTGNNAFFRSVNGGSNWTAINPASGLTSLSNVAITSIEINPHDPTELWVAFPFMSGAANAGRVFHSTDGGGSWADVSVGLPANLPVNRILLDRYTAGGINMLYAATDVGVFFSNTATSNQWRPFNDFLPLVMVNDLALDKANGKLIAATFGRGLWYTDIPCCDFAPPLATVNNIQNTIWTTDRTLYADVRITTGSTLTISNCTVYMTKGRKITVEPGAKLIVDHAVLTNNCGPDNTWTGIEVWGNPLLPHTFPNQGLAEIRNGSVIENAYNAVYSGEFSSGLHNGGIIRASNSSFYNNRFSINIPEFNTGLNTSTVAACTFDCFKALHNGFGVLHHVAVVGTKGVFIGGCTFRNSAPAGTFTNNFRGNGVQCVNASVTIDHLDDLQTIATPCDYPDGAGNTFEGLSCGVNIYDYVSDPAREIFVLGSIFRNCQVGVAAHGDGYKKIYKNEFYWDDQLIVHPPALSPASAVIGIRCDEASQLHLDENMFLFEPSFNYTAGIGMYVKTSAGTSSLPSHIYNNTVIKQATAPTIIYGTYVEGNNPGLFLDCNAYTGCRYDWYILTQLPQLFPGQQGQPGAGSNTFSACTVGTLNIFSNYSFTLYTPVTPLCTGGSATVTVNSTTAASCPSTGQCTIRQNGYIIPGTQDQEGGGGDDGFVIRNGQPEVKTNTPSHAQAFHIWPNPSSGYFTLTYHYPVAGATMHAQVMNATGALVYETRSSQTSGQLRIPAEQWPAGIYYIHVDAGNGTLYTRKLSVIR